MRITLVLIGALALACGSNDSSGPSGTGGASSGGTGGASGGAAGASGGTGGSATGGAAGSGSGGAAGSSYNCSATTNPFSNVDCAAACQHFTAWGKSGACANPYAGDADCPLACDTIKNSMPYTNALFGCAAQESDCTAFGQCLASKCG